MMKKEYSRGLSLARGFIVLIMPAVHTVLLYSNSQVKAGWLGAVLGFLAEQPGAQLFMLQMGLFIGIGRQKTFRAVLKRFLTLLLAGYLLNFLRLVLPYWWGAVPPAFLESNQIAQNAQTALKLLLAGDILQFAALGYLICQLIQYIARAIFFKAVLFFLLLFISPLTWQLQADGYVAAALLGLFNGRPPEAFFPVFPWLCYPVAGLIIAQVVKQYHQGFKVRYWGIVSVLFVGVALVIMPLEPPGWNAGFYRLGPGGTIFHLGAALAWMVLFIFISGKIPPNRFFSSLQWLSSKITPVYFIQWVTILWLLPVFGFASLSLLPSLFSIFITSTISFGLTYLITKGVYSKAS